MSMRYGVGWHSTLRKRATQYYGGTERVVSCLTEELVRQGHDVIRAINLLELLG